MKKDKIKHVLAGLLMIFVGLPCYQLTYDAATDTYVLAPALWATLVGGIILAGCKEWCDMHTDGNKWDWMDFCFTCIGVVVIVLLLLGIHYGLG